MGNLEGRRVLVTRTRSQASRLSVLLQERGAVAVECPLLAVEPLDSFAVRSAAGSVRVSDLLVFTSQNGVRVFSGLIENHGDLPAIYTVGPATKSAVKRWLDADAKHPVSHFVAESLLELLIEEGVSGKSVSLVVAEETRDILATGLRAAGASVTVVPVYKTAIHPDAAGSLQLAFRGGVDAVTVASSKTMEVLHRALPSELRVQLQRTPIVSIGPITSATAVTLGYDVAAEADPATLEGLIVALAQALG